MSEIGREPIEVTIYNTKKGKKPTKADPKAKYERMLKALKKKFSIASLKTHLVCWVAHGFYLNKLCLPQPSLYQALIVSYSTQLLGNNDNNINLEKFNLKEMKMFLKNAHDLFIKDETNRKKLFALSLSGDEKITPQSLTKAIEDPSTINYLQYILVLLISLRHLGVKARLCVCFDVLEINKPDKSVPNGPTTSKGLKRKKEENSANEEDVEDDVDSKEPKAKRKSHE